MFPAHREDGQLLMLPLASAKEAGALSGPTSGLRGGIISNRDGEGKKTPQATETASGRTANTAPTAAQSATTPEMKRRAAAAMRILGADAGKSADALEAELRQMEERGQAASGPGKRKADAMRDLIAYKRAVGTAKVSDEEVAEAKRRDEEERLVEGRGERLPSEDFYGRRQSRGKGAMPAKWTPEAQKPLERVARALRNAVTLGGKKIKVLFAPRPESVDGDTRYMRNGDGEVVGEYDDKAGTITLYPGATVADVVHEFTHPLVDHARAEAEAGRPEFLDKIREIIDAVRAIWKGGADVSDPANWTCYDDVGDVIANKLPGMYVTNITLEADCDFQNWNGGAFHNGAVIDLMGHALEVVNLPNAVFPNTIITNSVSGTTATLGVTVANGVTASDSTAAIGGNVRFVKRGAGTFVGSVSGQTYTGGTEVADGMLKAGIKGTFKPFGAPVSEADLANIEVAPGAIFDFAQKCGWGGYRVTLAGGTLQNSGGGFGDSDGGTFTNIVITADGSRFDSPGFPTPWGVFGNGTGSDGYAPTSIDLGSHDLTINVSWYFQICNTTITGDGDIVVKGGDPFRTGVKGRNHANGEIAATNVNFRIETQLGLYAPFSLHDYEAAYNNLGGVGTDSAAEMKVFGTFRPADHDAFYGCTMQDGSAIDLKNRTGEGKIPFNLTCAMTSDCAHKAVTFAPGATVTVDLSAFDVKTLVNTYVLTWDAQPADSVKFVPDAATAKRSYMFRKDSTGLKLISAGFTIFVR